MSTVLTFVTVWAAVSGVAGLVISGLFIYWDGRFDGEIDRRYPSITAYKNTYSGIFAAIYDAGFISGQKAHGRAAKNKKRFENRTERPDS